MSDPLIPAVVERGPWSTPQELLDRFRPIRDQLLRDRDPSAREDLRAALSFLRRRLHPWVLREQSGFGPGGPPAPERAHDLAFLEEKVGELTVLLRSALESPSGADTPARAEVRGLTGVVGAVLELLAASPVGKGVLAADLAAVVEGAPPARGPSWRGSETRIMAPEQIGAFLRLGFWGVLTTADSEGRPFGTPVSYGWNGEGLFVSVGRGRKARNLHQNPWSVLNVVEVEQGVGWWSVVATGKAEFIRDYPGRVEAWEAIRSQRERTLSVSDEDVSRLEVVRLIPVEMSGRIAA